MTTDQPNIRAAATGDWDAIADLLWLLFHGGPDQEQRAAAGELWEAGRALVAVDGVDIVGHASAFTRAMAVPGGVVPAAHVTQVGVAPTHRRRGILRALMQRQLGAVQAVGVEPFAVLWASEGRIYPRFGYGPAASRLNLRIDTRETDLQTSWRRPGERHGRLRMVTPPDALAELRRVFDVVQPTRPGWSTRSPQMWNYLLTDSESSRDGATERRAALVEGPGGPTGFALWRTKEGWDDDSPAAEVRIDSVIAVDPASYAELWRFLLGIDLARVASFAMAAEDEPLRLMVAEPARLRARVGEALWVRLVDVGAALAARRYAVDVDVVIEVEDELLPANAGRWRLRGGPDGAGCDRTGAPADVVCDIRTLGAAFLGGPTLARLADAGQGGSSDAGALTRASLAFAGTRAPSACEIF
ncbi:GNAT family N-acetyltransferase [Pilimelia columellifera]|uniref:Amikacin resistance N-acetyltransferase Eis2 n=1 Tax=Pilimelia columellifera subsp. columellifera TaxID=706583 RepID=A0ABN3NSL3_9ACTN